MAKEEKEKRFGSTIYVEKYLRSQTDKEFVLIFTKYSYIQIVKIKDGELVTFQNHFYMGEYTIAKANQLLDFINS